MVGTVSTATQIRERRDALEITRLRLAQAVGVSERTFARYEAGQSQPPLDVAAAIAVELGCSVDDLLGHPSAA